MEVFFTSGKPMLSPRNWNTGIPPDKEDLGNKREQELRLTQEKNSSIYGQRG